MLINLNENVNKWNITKQLVAQKGLRNIFTSLCNYSRYSNPTGMRLPLNFQGPIQFNEAILQVFTILLPELFEFSSIRHHGIINQWKREINWKISGQEGKVAAASILIGGIRDRAFILQSMATFLVAQKNFRADSNFFLMILPENLTLYLWRKIKIFTEILTDCL